MDFYGIDLPNTEFPKESCVLALGFFDGIHVGHRKILENTVALAREKGIGAAVFLFRDDGLFKSGAKRISTEAQKLEIMKEIGIKSVYTASFPSLSSLDGEEFAEKILKETCCAEYVVCGENFRFGRGALSDAKMLSELFGERAIVIPCEKTDGKIISSTYIRGLLENGELSRAHELLYSPISYEGEIVHGYANGGKMGFPTINILPEKNRIIPENGVYASVTEVRGKKYLSISNIGIRPTFGGDKISFETHIFGESAILYGERARVTLLGFLREEIKFESKEALCRQIETDAARVKKEYGKFMD